MTTTWQRKGTFDCHSICWFTSRMSLVSERPRSEREQHNAAFNAFLLWLQCWLLILTGIPALHNLGLSFFGHPMVVPKTLELKLYALAMATSFIVAYAARFCTWLERDCTAWRLFLIALLLGTSIIDTIGIADTSRAFLLCGGSLAALTLFFAENLLHRRWALHWKGYCGWFIAVSLSVFTILGARNPNGAVFQFVTPVGAVVFALTFLWLRFVHFKHRPLELLVPVFLAIVVFVTSGGLYDTHHYDFFLGPVAQILYGHTHPLEIDAQYGAGLTGFLGLYFDWRGAVSDEGLHNVIMLLTFLQYSLVYLIAAQLYASRKIAFMTLLAILIVSFYSQTRHYFAFPSIGFLRFGWGYLALIVYSVDRRWMSEEIREVLLAIIASFGVIWSFESAVYTLPAIAATEWYRGSFGKFYLYFAFVFSALLLVYVLPVNAQGHTPIPSRYFEYATLYAKGFGQISLPRAVTFWWLIPSVYSLSLILLLTRRIQDHRLFMLTLYGAAILTYFVGRAHPNNTFHISIPFILISVYLLTHWQTRLVWKQLSIAATIAFFSTAVHQYLATGMVITNLTVHQRFNISALNPLHLFKSAHAQATDPEPGCRELYTPLVPYIVDGSLPIITGDGGYRIYACLRVGNGFGIGSFGAAEINENASHRIVEAAPATRFRNILVWDQLHERGLTQALLIALQAQPTNQSLEIEGRKFLIFKRSLGF